MSDLIQQREDHTREFEQSWSDHEKKLEESSKQDIQALEEIHAQQLQEAREHAEATLGTVYKPSSKLLDNRRVFEQLVKQKKYSEAHQLKAENEQIEIYEQQRFTEVREAKIAKLMEKTMTRQKIEMMALRKKLDYQVYEQRRVREAETIQ